MFTRQIPLNALVELHTLLHIHILDQEKCNTNQQVIVYQKGLKILPMYQLHWAEHGPPFANALNTDGCGRVTIEDSSED
jgi:hypothetical protein